MKALIIYNHVWTALKAMTSLRNAASAAETRTQWQIELWSSGLTRFHALADEALREGSDADLLVYAAHQDRVLPPCTRVWLDRWAARRTVADAALAWLVDETGDARGEVACEFRSFAAHHNLTLLTLEDTPPEKPHQP